MGSGNARVDELLEAICGSSPAPTNCRHEPDYPAHNTVVFAIAAPDLTVHAASDRCPIEGPHATACCGEWCERPPLHPPHGESTMLTSSPAGRGAGVTRRDEPSDRCPDRSPSLIEDIRHRLSGIRDETARVAERLREAADRVLGSEPTNPAPKRSDAASSTAGAISDAFQDIGAELALCQEQLARLERIL